MVHSAALEWPPSKCCEQAGYDETRLSIRSTHADVVPLSEDWIYALTHVEGEAVSHGGVERSTFRATKRGCCTASPRREWVLARHMWNRRP
jgi:hypothetical protein